MLKKNLLLITDHYALINWDTGLKKTPTKTYSKTPKQNPLTTKNPPGLALQKCFNTTNDNTSKNPDLAAKCAALCLSKSNRFTSAPRCTRARTTSTAPSLAASIKAVRQVACRGDRDSSRFVPLLRLEQQDLAAAKEQKTASVLFVSKRLAGKLSESSQSAAKIEEWDPSNSKLESLE